MRKYPMTKLCVTINSHLFNIESTINIANMFESNISNNQTESIRTRTIHWKNKNRKYFLKFIMKLFALLWLSIVCVEVKSYTSKRHETEALHRSLKANEGKKINWNDFFWQSMHYNYIYICSALSFSPLLKF